MLEARHIRRLAEMEINKLNPITVKEDDPEKVHFKTQAKRVKTLPNKENDKGTFRNPRKKNYEIIEVNEEE